MLLTDFFAAAEPFLRGDCDVTSFRAVGETPSADADLAFYPSLVANDQQRVLGELFPRCQKLATAAGLDWPALIRAFIEAHPPSGFTVVAMGEPFPDWLQAQAEQRSFPAGLVELADFACTRLQVKMAPDADDIGLDRRLFVRSYPVDVQAIEIALDHGEPLPPEAQTTLFIYRHEPTGRVRCRGATLPLLAALMSATGLPLEGPFERSPADLQAARDQLVREGVLPCSTNF